MEIPNSPVEFMQRCLMDQLDGLPEGSTVQISADALRQFYLNYQDAIDLINEQQRILDDLVQNS